MISYWLLLLIPAFFACVAPRQRWSASTCFFIWLILTLSVGLRYQVGGDWEIYLYNLDLIRDIPLQDLNLIRDPSYELASWISLRLGWDIYGVNLICAALFSFGLVFFCRAQPRSWLALCLSIPYLVIVVAMGYTRQAVSIGLLMPGFLYLARGNLRFFILFVILAASFHQTSLITLAFLLPMMPGRTLLTRILRILVMTIVAFSLAQLFLAARLEVFVQGYLVSQTMNSEGAAIRVAMNAIPAIVFLFFYKRLALPYQETRLWIGISLLAIFCIFALKLIPSSTVVDRLALYAIPLQIYVGSRIPDFRLIPLKPLDVSLLTVGLAILVQFVWLFFAKTAFAWLPYNNLLFFI